MEPEQACFFFLINIICFWKIPRFSVWIRKYNWSNIFLVDFAFTMWSGAGGHSYLCEPWWWAGMIASEFYFLYFVDSLCFSDWVLMIYEHELSSVTHIFFFFCDFELAAIFENISSFSNQFIRKDSRKGRLYVLSVDSLTLDYWFYRNRKKERKFEWPCIHNMMPKCQVTLNCTANCKRKTERFLL
jgi:hypothetical protein